MHESTNTHHAVTRPSLRHLFAFVDGKMVVELAKMRKACQNDDKITRFCTARTLLGYAAHLLACRECVSSTAA